MEIPYGRLQYNSYSNVNLVCFLRKSIYGLKQDSRLWFEKLVAVLLSFGFKQTTADYSLFIYHHQSSFIVALVYVGDILLTGTNSDLISQVDIFIDKFFIIKDLGLVKYYLGLEVSRFDSGIFFPPTQIYP